MANDYMVTNDHTPTMEDFERVEEDVLDALRNGQPVWRFHSALKDYITVAGRIFREAMIQVPCCVQVPFGWSGATEVFGDCSLNKYEHNMTTGHDYVPVKQTQEKRMHKHEWEEEPKKYGPFEFLLCASCGELKQLHNWYWK